MVGEKDGNVSVTLLLSGLASDLGSPIDISLTITQEKSGKLASILPTSDFCRISCKALSDYLNLLIWLAT